MIRFLLLSAACTSATSTTPVVSAGAWMQAEVDLLDHRTNDAECALNGWNEELGGMEIDTSRCPYANLQQPSLVNIERGDTLRVEGWHSDLIYTEPSEAHIALLTDGGELWETHVEIPHAADTWDQIVTAPIDVAVGEPIYLHLHNHGANTYNVNAVTIAR